MRLNGQSAYNSSKQLGISENEAYLLRCICFGVFASEIYRWKYEQVAHSILSGQQDKTVSISEHLQKVEQLQKQLHQTETERDSLEPML